jgi:hypothetical protein
MEQLPRVTVRLIQDQVCRLEGLGLHRIVTEEDAMRLLYTGDLNKVQTKREGVLDYPPPPPGPVPGGVQRPPPGGTALFLHHFSHGVRKIGGVQRPGGGGTALFCTVAGIGQGGGGVPKYRSILRLGVVSEGRGCVREFFVVLIC